MEREYEPGRPRRLKTPAREKSHQICDEVRETGRSRNLTDGSFRQSCSRERSRQRSRSRSRRRHPSPQRSHSRRRDVSCVTQRASLLERERRLARERLQALEKELQVERDKQRRTDEETMHQVSEVRDCSFNGTNKRSSNPTFAAKDVISILNSFKNQPSVASPFSHSHSVSNHKNILPDFDPSSKSQRIDVWLRKVNECASVYGWDEKTTVHFAMQKLQGLAKMWYESLDSILFSWAEWQVKLVHAFPFEQNYGQSLEDMLKRKSEYHEPIEVYYYEKLALLNQCGITGKRAVDCIIHGLSDKTMKSSALALRCIQPDQLLQFLMSNKEPIFDSFHVRSRLGTGYVTTARNDTIVKSSQNLSPNDSSVFCFNCKERGHAYRNCTKPLIRCNQCHLVGHGIDECPTKSQNVRSTLVTTNAQKL